MGAIQVVATSEGLGYRAYRHWGEARTEFDGSSGKLRIERRGTDLVYQYWDDGWSELFVSPDIDVDLDMFFRIELRSTDERAVVVALDNLEVTSMIRPPR